MNRILKNSLIIGGILGATTGLIFYFRKQFNLLANSCYAITGGVIHNISLDDTKITIFLKIKNTSQLSLTIENLSLNIYVNNLFVSNILKKEKQTIPSNGSVVIQLDVSFSPKSLFKAGLANITPLLTDKSKLIINIKGTLDAEMPPVRINKMPIEQTISLQDLLSPKPNTTKC